MCQPNCKHTELCKLRGTGYECDLNNDSVEYLCDTCRDIVKKAIDTSRKKAITPE